MRIGRGGRIGHVGSTAPAGGGAGTTRGAGFGALLAPPAAEVLPAAPLAPPVLPALTPAGDEAALAHGTRALGALRDLQLGLLAGADAGALPDGPEPQAADPALQSVLEDIRLRQAVERARREAAGDRR